MKLRFKKWTEEEFFEMREEVLKGWPTGKEVNLEEAVAFHKALPESKSFSKKLVDAKKAGITLAQPRAGVALIEQHIELLDYLDKVGGADLLPSTIDSYTRQNKYENCEKGIEESKKAGRSLLNGFPGVNHGVTGCRQVVEAIDLPLQLRHGTPDARLLSEIMIAAGYTSDEGGGISYNVPYAKSVSLERTLIDWQYVDRLVGWYEEHGVSINREPFGPLTGTLVPPSMSNAVGILEGLLAAEQGVKNITLGYGQCGNLIQDVAAIRALTEQGEEYFKEYGYNDIDLTTVFHQWMGGFPEDEAKAFGVISNGASAAALAGATKVIVKTPHEAIGVPTKEANAMGIIFSLNLFSIQLCLYLMKIWHSPILSMSPELAKEIDVIKAETKCILNKVLELGEGDWAIGVVKAFEQGVLDVPFAPSKYNAGKMMPARDNVGKVRYLAVGNVPLSKELVDFNLAQLEERAKFEGRPVGFQMTVDDIFAVGKGTLIGRPETEHMKNN